MPTTQMTRTAPAPAPMVIVFDGYCRLCTNLIRLIRRLEVHGRLRPVPSQAPEVLERYALTKEDVGRAVWLIDETGRKYEGAAAANQIFKAIGGPWRLLAMLYAIPPVRWLENRIYAWVSHNRHHFGWMWKQPAFCESPENGCLPPFDAVSEAEPTPALAAPVPGEPRE